MMDRDDFLSGGWKGISFYSLSLFFFFENRIATVSVSAGSKHSFDELYKFRVIRVERDICIGERVENCSGTIHATNSKLFI